MLITGEGIGGSDAYGKGDEGKGYRILIRQQTCQGHAVTALPFYLG